MTGRLPMGQKELLNGKVMELVKQRYSDFGPVFAAEKLREQECITVGVSSLRRWLVAEGL